MSRSLKILFFLSGWTGLVYEVLWAKVLALTLGSSAAAHTFVLTTFLGGMAAGYALLGRFADRHPNPLRLYAHLELAIAAVAALTPFALGSLWGLVLVPIAAALMGGTLPALSRRGAVAELYFLNSLGAAAGSLCAGFVLIPAFGLDASVWLAAVVNAAIAGVALQLAKGPSLPPRAPAPEPDLPPRPLFYAVACASGFISLALEIAWIRMLALIFGSTVYSFSVMLAAFITGIGAGAWFVGRPRVAAIPPLRALILVQLVSVAALMLTLPFYERAAFLPLAFDAMVERRKDLFLAFEAAKFAFSFALMFIPAACFGMVPPLAARAAVREEGERGERVGAVFSWNAIGNVAGAACAGLWLLPALGMQGLFNAAVGLQVALAFALIAIDKTLSGRGLWAVSLGGAAAAFFGLAPVWSPMQMSFGAFRQSLPEKVDFATYRKVVDGFELLYHKDGREATVSVVAFDSESRALKVNGKTDASTTRDLRTQILASQLPILLHGNPARLLVIGHGSGITVGGALTHPVESVDVVELSPEVIEADRFFAPFNGNALNDPRTTVHVEDGRSFLLRGDDGYDIIISEPSNPWMAGVGALFTAEYYAKARERLNPGGVVAQWFHFYEMNRWTLRLVLRTFASQFPETSIWLTFTGDVLLLGSEKPFELDPEGLAAAMRRPAVKADLARIGIDRPATLLALQMAGDATFRRLGGEGPLNRDRFPRLEHEAPLGFFLRKRTNLLFYEEDGFRPERAKDLLLARYERARGRPLSPSELAAVDAYHGAYRTRFRETIAARWRAAAPRDAAAILAHARAIDDRGDTDRARALLAEGRVLLPGNARLLERSAAYAEAAFFEGGDAKAAREALSLLEKLPTSSDAERRRAKLHRELGEFEAALARWRAAAEQAERNEEPAVDEIWMEVAELALQEDRGPLVVDALEYALKANPQNDSARDMLDALVEHFKKAE